MSPPAAPACQEAPPPALLEGIAQFNRRDFFLCHETLEGLWRQEAGPIRELYRGVLQVAVGCYHLERSNARGALYSFEHGIVRLRAFAPICFGIEVSRLIDGTQRLVELLLARGESRASDFDRSLLPFVTLSPVVTLSPAGDRPGESLNGPGSPPDAP